MPSSDTIKAQQAATAAEVAAATAKLYAQSQQELADDAAASATEASGYAQKASDSASLAQQYYSMSIEGVLWFVGDFSTAPMARSNGSALEPGDMYKNTADNLVYSYNSDGTWSTMNSDATTIQDLYAAGEDLLTQGKSVYSDTVAVYEQSQDLYQQSTEQYDVSVEMYDFYKPSYEKVEEIQSGDTDIESSVNLWGRLQKTGMFKYDEIPGEGKGIAGFVFGGSADDDNRAAIIIDERGRIQSYAVVNGSLTAQRVSAPFTMGTGYFNNQFEDRVARFPCAGQEDDDLSPGMLFTWDSSARKYRAAVMSPFMVGDKGYPTNSLSDQGNLLSFYYDVGYGPNHSFDHFMTQDVASLQWGKLCTIAKSSSGVSKFSAIITAGNYVNYGQSTYLVDVNGQNLVSTLTAGNISQSNIDQWIKIQRISDTSVSPVVQNDIPEVGVSLDSSGNAVVWLKVPYHSPRVSILVLSLDNPANISVDWSLWKSNSLASVEPSSIVYGYTEFQRTSRNNVRVNSGDIVYAPHKVMRVKDAMSSSSTLNRMAEFSDYGFTLYSDFFSMNRSAGSSVTVSRSSTGTYSVSGVTLSSDFWKVKQPISFLDGTSAATVSITSSASGSFSFTVKDSSSNLVNIPDGTWIDFHVN